MTSRAPHPFLVRLAALVGLSGAVVTLLRAGAVFGADAGMPGWPLDLSDPTLVVVEVVRSLALVGATWLLGVTLLDTIAGWLRLAPLATLAGRITPAFWRHAVLRPVATLALVAPPVLAPAMSVTPAAALVASAHATDVAGEAPSEHPAALLTMSRGGAAADRAVTAEAPTLTMAVLVDAGPPADVIHPAVEPPTEASPLAPSVGSAHVVRSGDNLWSIAAAHLAEVRGTRPTGREVTPYWRAVIDANREVLPDPTNPDLLFPGVVLHLPPVA